MAELPASEGFRTLIAAHVAVSGWDVHTGIMPPTPDRAIALYDTGGLDPNPKWLIDFPTVQVLVRGGVGDYIVAFQEAKTLKDILLGVNAQTINGDRWDGINMNGDLGYIGRDEQNRPLFSMNFALIIEPQVVVDSNRDPC